MKYETLDTQSVTLQPQSVTLQQLKFASFGGQHTVEILRDMMTQGYVLQIRSKFHALKRDYATKPQPATWWDHFKRDAIPTITRWLKLRVELRSEVVSAATIFPDVPQIPGGRFYYMDVNPMLCWKEDERKA